MGTSGPSSLFMSDVVEQAQSSLHSAVSLLRSHTIAHVQSSCNSNTAHPEASKIPLLPSSHHHHTSGSSSPLASANVVPPGGCFKPIPFHSPLPWVQWLLDHDPQALGTMTPQCFQPFFQQHMTIPPVHQWANHMCQPWDLSCFVTDILDIPSLQGKYKDTTRAALRLLPTCPL